MTSNQDLVWQIKVFFVGYIEYVNNIQQDGPSLESSSYLNVSLRYHGP